MICHGGGEHGKALLQLDLAGGEHLAGLAMGEESLSQEKWGSERLPLVCPSKIACCVVVVEVLKLAVLQGSTDSLVAFCLGVELGDKDSHRSLISSVALGFSGVWPWLWCQCRA